MKFLGAWRPILRNLFEQKRKQYDISSAEYVKRIINNQNEKLELILDIFGIEDETLLSDTNLPKQVEQIKLPFQFLQREKYSNLVTDSVIELILNFIKDFIGEEISNSDDSMSNSKSKLKRDSSKDCCVLIFDNASIMDEESWSLILRVHSQCSNICTVMIVGQDSKGNAILPKLEIAHKRLFANGK